MKLLRILSGSFLVVLAGCASTEFKGYEGRNNIIEGQGGTRVVVDGMDLWENGDPPRRFRFLGIIEDERSAGSIQMYLLKSDVVKKAREAGGDALVQVRSQAQIVGYQSTGNATGTAYGNTLSFNGSSTTTAIRRNAATFAVIKYID